MPKKTTKKAPDTLPVQPNPVGRPPVDMNLADLEKLLSMQATDKEIADWFGVTKQAISARKKNDPRFKDAYQRGRNKGKASLRRLMWEKAQGREGEIMRDDEGAICFDDKNKVMWRILPIPPDTVMQIWLSKNLLNFKDKQEVTGEGGAPVSSHTTINVISESAKQLTEALIKGEGT